MTVVCPSGHESQTSDYCDQCGTPIAAVAAAPPATEVLPEVEDEDTSAAALNQPCPSCGALRSSGRDRYCEGCGHDFSAPPEETSAWEAVTSADRRQFERLGPSGVSFPADYAVRRFTLGREAVRIGRSRGQENDGGPEIDLAGEPEDPGISRLHAVLERQAGGGYAVRDLGSTNGTTINDDPAPVGSDTPVPLADGDRIRVGAWTTITLRAR